jgi:ABC-type antimicrobial peptide transport system permease subunit
VGAQRKDVAYGILTRALRISGLGLIIGIPAAYLCARLMESQLFGIGTFNPLILFFAVILLLTVTVLASLLPARRAMQVNPVDALRAE